MRAAVVTRCGEPPAFAEAADPAAAAGNALVEVRAAPITPLDVLCATGTSYFGEPAVPYVPGVQGVGTVREGERLAAGTRVWFQTSAGIEPGDGTMAELASIPEEGVVEVPDDVDDATAAALGLSAVAAWAALTLRGELRAGESVLVLGAGGTVGQVAVQAARILGAARVVAAARSRRSGDLALSRGADAVVATSEAADGADLAARLERACEGGVDVVVDPVFGTAASAALRTMRPGGRLVQLGGAGGATATFDSATIRGRSLSILGYTNVSLSDAEAAGILTTVLGHAAAGRLGVAHEDVPLSGVSEAWRRQESGAASSRIVLRPGPAG